MATITLTEDRLISSLMPSGGGSLASDDTIQLAGHSLIIDADAVDYKVNLANSGGACRVELRDGGRVSLGFTPNNTVQSLPSNVELYIDPENPLPADFEEESQYITGFTANARAEVILPQWISSLGGSAYNIPTKTRAGNFWAFSVSYPASNKVQFDRPMPVHVGDGLMFLSAWNALGTYVVTAVESDTVCEVSREISSSIRNKTTTVGLLAGGVVIRTDAGGATLDPNSPGILSAPCKAGTLAVIGNGSRTSVGSFFIYNSAPLVADRFVGGMAPGFSYAETAMSVGFGNSSVRIKQCITPTIWSGMNSATALRNRIKNAQFDEAAFFSLCWSANFCDCLAPITIGGGAWGTSLLDGAGANMPNSSGLAAHLKNVSAPFIASPNIGYGAVHLENCTLANVATGDLWLSSSGTVKKMDEEVGGVSGTWIHSPATSSDATWRHTDRTVPAGATLRLRCAWRRDGSAATRASVAVTDTSTWWPRLWPLGADALASVEFTGGSADWRSELLAWRNTSSDAATVRVWECVTGTTAGGYLKVEEVKGGQL